MPSTPAWQMEDKIIFYSYVQTFPQAYCTRTITRIWGLYDGYCPNLHRCDKPPSVVPSDCLTPIVLGPWLASRWAKQSLLFWLSLGIVKIMLNTVNICLKTIMNSPPGILIGPRSLYGGLFVCPFDCITVAGSGKFGPLSP